MKKKRTGKMLAVLLSITILAAAIFVVIRLVTIQLTRSTIFDVATAPNYRVAIVFGAGLRRDGRPTPVLQDRVEVASQLYFAGKVDRLIMSGDNRFVDYNEPGSMQAYAISLGVPEEAIVLDYAGRRTYDTCYRAKAIFGVQEAILVTQNFHLPRALFTCSRLGIEASGVAADVRTYTRRSQLIWNIREIPATLVAWLDVYWSHPVPVLGDPEPIFNDESNPSKTN